MTNLNMRRILKTPTLRMMDGGSIQVPQGPGMDRAGMLERNPGVAQNQLTSPSAPLPAPAAPAAPVSPILRDGNSFSQAPGSQGPTARPIGAPPVAPTIDQGAAMDRKMLAASAPVAPAAPTPAGVSPTPAATTQGQRQAGFAMQAFGVAPAIKRSQPDPVLGMKDGGSYENGQGGVVPGPPRGDKFKAVYEGGERVVSNKVQRDNPGLAPLLDSLRAETLAREGKTVAEADAKAVGGETLRAAGGFSGAMADALEKNPSWGAGREEFVRTNTPGWTAETAAKNPAPVFERPALPSKMLRASELDLRNNTMPQPMPAASVAADTLAGNRNAAKLNTLRDASNAATSAPGRVTSPPAAPTQAPTPHPTITQMNQPGVDFRNAQYAERVANEVEHAARDERLTRAANPRSMTVKELFSRGDGSSRGPNAMKFAPAVPQTAANAAANIAVGAPSVVPPSVVPPAAPDPTRLQKGLAWADEALTGLGKTKAGALALRAMNSPVGKVAGKLGGVSAQFASHHGEAGAPTLDAERVAALSRPYDPDWKPTSGAQTTQRPAANLPGQDATMPGQDPGRAAADPKLVQGADGRQYLPEAVSDGDRLRSDGMIKQAFSRDSKVGGEFSMDNGINTLRSSPSDMATANKAWATRGAGVQASYDSKGGLVLSNSTGPEKMRYTDREGNPTSQYENTAQYDNGQKQLAAASASLRNPDGTKWSANDTATMAANLRDGVDQYRGTSRAPTQAGGGGVEMSPQRARLEALGAKGMSRTQAATLQALRSSDQQLEASMAQNKVSRDNNEMTNQTNLRNQDMKLQGDREQAAGTKANALAAKAEADRKYELDVARFGVESANKTRDDRRAGEEAFDKRVESMSGAEDAPAVRTAVNGYLAKQEGALVAALKKNPNDPALQGELAAIREQGRSGISDPLLRKLMQGVKANRVAQQGSGNNMPFNPWDGTSVNTDQPVQTLVPDQSFTSRWLPGAGKYVTDNGQKILASDVEKNPTLKELIR